MPSVETTFNRIYRMLSKHDFKMVGISPRTVQLPVARHG
jgi:hypothetical protein